MLRTASFVEDIVKLTFLEKKKIMVKKKKLNFVVQQNFSFP